MPKDPIEILSRLQRTTRLGMILGWFNSGSTRIMDHQILDELNLIELS